MKNLLLRKFILRVILYTAFFPYLVMIAMALSDTAFNLYGKFFFNKTYIRSINLPSYPEAENILKEFNSMGDNKIVSFEEIPNGRPIDIAEMTQFDFIVAPNAVGIARPRATNCTIGIKNGLDKPEFREVLLHEYLHCYGYDHSPDSTDLMYYSLNPIDKEENIRQYAKKMKKKFYE